MIPDDKGVANHSYAIKKPKRGKNGRFKIGINKSEIKANLRVQDRRDERVRNRIKSVYLAEWPPTDEDRD